MKTKGFTLVELLVVIAILAILATVSVVGYTSYISSTEEQAAITEARSARELINAGLVLNDYVILVHAVADDTTTEDVNETVVGLYVTEDNEVVTTAPTEGKGHDASADWKLTGTLTSDDGVLYYTVNDYKVNLSTLEIVEDDE